MKLSEIDLDLNASMFVEFGREAEEKLKTFFDQRNIINRFF